MTLVKLDRDQIQDIVRLQLEQVRRAAEGQGIRLEFDDSLIRYLAVMLILLIIYPVGTGFTE
jgi:ATP-dependent Clp protease ATP-binding subunit ClpA